MAATERAGRRLPLDRGHPLAPETLPPLVTLTAPSPLGDDALESLAEALTGGGATLARQTLDGTALTAPEVRREFGTGTLGFETVRLVVIRHAQSLDAAAQTTLAGLAADLPPGTTVVLWATEAKAPTYRKPLAEALRTHSRALEVKVPKGRDLRAWVQTRAAGTGAPLGDEAAVRLLERAGDDLTLLDSELRKLALLSDGRKPITAATVESIVPPAASESIFRLVDAVAEGRAPGALAVLHELRSRGEESALGIVAMVARHFRLLWQARALVDTGWRGTPGQYPPRGLALLPTASRASLPDLLGRQGWLGTRVVAQAKRFEPRQLARVFRRLLAADLALKRTSDALGDDAVLQDLVLDLCDPRG